MLGYLNACSTAPTIESINYTLTLNSEEYPLDTVKEGILDLLRYIYSVDVSIGIQQDVLVNKAPYFSSNQANVLYTTLRFSKGVGMGQIGDIVEYEAEYINTTKDGNATIVVYYTVEFPKAQARKNICLMFNVYSEAIQSVEVWKGTQE